MKLTLKDAVSNLRVVCKEDGYELHNGAGVAYYDVYGARGRVEGVPEYFPVSLCLDVNSDCKLSKMHPDNIGAQGISTSNEGAPFFRGLITASRLYN